MGGRALTRFRRGWRGFLPRDYSSWRRILTASDHQPDGYQRDDNARDVAEMALLVLKITAMEYGWRVGTIAVEKHHCGPHYGYLTGVTHLAPGLLHPIA